MSRHTTSLILCASALLVPAATASLEDAIADRLLVGEYELMNLDLPVEAVDSFRTTVVHDGATYTVALLKHSVRSPDFQLLVQIADGSIVEQMPPPVRTYRGTVLELPGSVVAASLLNGQLTAAVHPVNGEDWFVQPVTEADSDAEPTLHLTYAGEDVQANEPWFCGVDDVHADGPHDHAGGGFTSRGVCTYTTEIAYDADVEFYNENGSSVANTVADIESITNGMEVIYERDVNITYEITTTLVRTSEPDPYSTSNSSSLLGQFQNEWNANQTGINRDVAHLMTGKNLSGSVIGVAYLGVICSSTSGYGLSESRYTSNFNFRVGLTAHELGHNWSAPHCNGDSDCWIMCSGIGGCGGSVTVFGSASISTITNYRDGRPCLETGTQPPTAVDDLASTPFDQSILVDVLDNDLNECGGTLDIIPGTAVTANGGFVIMSIGTGPGGRDELQYLPPFLVSGTPWGGTDTFTYQVTNGLITSSPATVSIDVTGAPQQPDELLLMVFRNTASVPGLGNVRNEDIVLYDETTDSWAMAFDGSDLGLNALAIDAIRFIDNGGSPELLMSLTRDADIPGIVGAPGGGTLVDDADLIHFAGTFGTNTSGTLTFHFDGSDVDMASNGEDIDALEMTDTGDLVLSVIGVLRSGSFIARDEDLALFVPTSLGENTSGTFSLHFDGSDVGLSDTSQEDVSGVAFAADGSILMTTLGDFSVAGASGADEDVFMFDPTTLGDSTSGTFSLVHTLTTLGIDASEDVNALGFTDLDLGLGLRTPPARPVAQARPVCPGDFNDDGSADSTDVRAFLAAFSQGSMDADYDEDGELSSLDLVEFLRAWGDGC